MYIQVQRRHTLTVTSFLWAFFACFAAALALLVAAANSEHAAALDSICFDQGTRETRSGRKHESYEEGRRRSRAGDRTSNLNYAVRVSHGVYLYHHFACILGNMTVEYDAGSISTPMKSMKHPPVRLPLLAFCGPPPPSQPPVPCWHLVVSIAGGVHRRRHENAKFECI